MSNVDPRLVLARQIAANRRPVSVAPLAVGPTTTGPRPSQMSPETTALKNQVEDATTVALRQFPNLSDQINAAAQGQPQATGVKGLFGKLLSSTPVKVALQPLTILDIPRRAVISTAREMVDLLDTDPKTKASISDFVAQTKSPEFGFGTAFPMKGNWGRFAGFVGDVALDPLTYATLGTEHAVQGLGGSIALAGKYLDKFGDAAKAAKIAKLGKAALEAEEIAKLGLNRSGIYLFGSKLRVPLSGPIGESMLSGLTRARVEFTNTRFGAALQKGFMGLGGDGNKALKSIRLALARGEELPGGMAVDAGIRIVNSENARRAAMGVAREAVQRRMATELSAVGRDNLEAYKGVAYKWLEGTAIPQTPQEVAFFERFKTLFSDLWDDVDSDFRKLTPDSEGMNRVKEYFPWIMTDAAKEATTDMQTPWVKNLMSTLAPNPLDRVGSFRTRGLKQGAEFLWTVDDEGKKIPYILKSTDLNIDRINEISRGALGIDFFETDLEKALFSYSNSYAQQKGLLAMYGELSKSGLLRDMTRRGVVDEEAALAVSAAADNAVNNVIAGLGSTSKRLEDAFRLVGKRAESEIQRLGAASADAAKGLELAKQGITDVAQADLLSGALDAANTVTTLKNEIAGLKGSLDFLFDEVPPEVHALYDQYDVISKSLEDISTSINNLNSEANILDVRLNSQVREAAYTALSDKVDETVAKLNAAATNHQFFLELNQVLKSRFDDIIDGTTPKGLGRVGAILKGSRGNLPKREGAVTAIEDFAESPGRFQQWAKSKDGPLNQQEWFVKTQGFIGTKNLNKTGISKLSYGDVLDNVVRAAPTHQNSIELIQSAVYMLARDLKFHGAENPVLDSVRAELIQSLDEVSKVVGLVENRGAAILSDAKLDALRTEIDTNTAALSELYDVRNYRNELEDGLRQIDNFMSVRGGTHVLNNDEFSFFSDTVQNIILGMPTTGTDIPSLSEVSSSLRSMVDSMSQYEVIGHLDKPYTMDNILDLEKMLDTKQRFLDKTVEGKIPGGLKGLDVNKLIENIQPAVGQLADRVAQYTLASEVQRRFTALGKELAMFGLAPTEEMYSIVMRKVGEEFLDRTVSRESAALAARSEMENIRAAVTKEIGARGQWAETFTKMLEDAYNGPNGAAMEEVLGPIVQFTPDALKMKSKYASVKAASGRAEYLDESRKFAIEIQKSLLGEVDEKIQQSDIRKLLAKIANTDEVLTPDDFVGNVTEEQVAKFRSRAAELLDADKRTSSPVRDFVQDEWSGWFESSFPGRKFSMEAAQRQARLSPVSGEYSMRRFFNELLGGHYRSDASYAEKIGRNRWSRKGFVAKIANKSPGGEYIAAHVEGSLNTELSVLRERIGHLHKMIDPSVDYKLFLNDPFGLGGGPLSTADFLDVLANRLEKNIRDVPPAVRKEIGRAEAAVPKAEAAFDRLRRSVELMHPRNPNETAKDYSSRIQGLLDEMDPSNTRPFVAPKREDVIAPFVEPPKKPKESYKAYETRVNRMRANWERSQDPVYARKVKEAQDVWRAEIDKEVGGLANFYEKQAKMAEDFAGVREVRFERDRIVNSPEYVAATRDADMTEMIKKLADVNGWTAKHPITGEQGWFIQSANPNTSFDGLLSSLTDQRLRRDLLAAQPNIRSLQYVNVDELAGAELDGVFLMSPDKTTFLPYNKEEMRALNKRMNADRAEVRAFEKAGGKDAPGVTAERFLYIQQLKKELSEYDNNSFKFVKFGNFDGKKVHSIDDLVVLGKDAAAGTAAPVRKAMPELFERFGSVKATMVDAESLAQRKQVADLLLSSGVVDQQVYRRLTSEKTSINSVLLSKIHDERVGEVTIESLIGPEASKALREADKPLAFTKEEWLSLYEPLDAKRMGEVARETGALNKRMEYFKGLRDRGQQTITVNGERFVVAKEIESIGKRLEDLRVLAKTGSIAPGQTPVALQSALEKMDQLFAQIGEDSIGKPRRLASRMKTIKDNTFGSDRVAGTSYVNARKSAIQSRWEKTSSYSTLEKVRQIDASPAMEMFSKTETARRNAAMAVGQARQRAFELRSAIAPQEQDILQIMRMAGRDIAQFSQDGVEIYNRVGQVIKDLVQTSPDGVGSLNLQNISLRIPEDIKAAARQIRSQYISPAERDFVTAIAGRSTQADLWIAASEAAKAKYAFSAFETLTSNDEARLNEILNILNPPKGRLKAVGVGKPLTAAEMANPMMMRQRLTKQFDSLTKEINTLSKQGRKQFEKKLKDTIKQLGIKETQLAEAVGKMTEIQGRFDQIIPNLYSAESTMLYADTFIKPRIDELSDVLARAQAVGVGSRKKIVTPENYMDIVEIVDDFKTVMNNIGIAPDDPINKVFLDVVNANAEMMGRLTTAGQLQSEFIGTANFTNFERTLSEGYASLEKAGLKGVEAPKEVVDFFENMRRMKEPVFQRSVMNFLNNYTKFFKSYATLSPGFHVRNAMSNTFALIAAGGDPVNFTRGLKMYMSMRRALERGLTLEDWVASLPEAERAVADIASKSMYASGGGMTIDAFRGMSKKNGGVRGAFEDNFLLSGSRSIGGRLESSARFMLGYDSAVKGLDFNMASARVKRYLIDYEDVGSADEVIKQIIPFWMWTSRALPMHLTNQWMNPRAYAIYNSFKRNFAAKDDQGQIVPSWITEQGGFRVSGNTYLMPDLGFNRLGQQVAELGDPMRLLSQANPLIRLPIELAGGRKLYTGQQFKDKPVEVSGGVAALLQPLLQIAGYGQTSSEGKQFVDEKALYALQNLVPFLAQGERLLPSTDIGQEKQLQNVLSYFGVPTRQVTESQQQGEWYSRLRELNNIVSRAQTVNQ